MVVVTRKAGRQCLCVILFSRRLWQACLLVGVVYVLAG